MDEHDCVKCSKSTVGMDGICINCGWDKVLSEYAESDSSNSEYLEDLEEDDDEIEEIDLG